MSKAKQKKLIKKIDETVDGFGGFMHRAHRTKNHSIDFRSIGLKKRKLGELKEREIEDTISKIKKSRTLL